MAKTCGDCVFCGAKNGLRWERDEYCHKHDMDVSYDQFACAYFRDDSSGCCYDCDYFSDGLLVGGRCKLHKKSISAGSSYTCPDNTY